jgi:cob(I)alamin adenosyltransferase
MSIATKTGDNGTTALMFGRRVSKADDLIEATGTVDELNAALGVARASLQAEPRISSEIYAIQKELVLLMGELAVVQEDHARYEKSGQKFVTEEMVDRLTALVDDLERNHGISYKHWASPGETAASAALDMARTICRRAERRVVALQPPVNPFIQRYLNRLSDLCWLYARWIETKSEQKS